MLKQEAYRSMASALSEADGIIDYTDPEEVSPKPVLFFSFVTLSLIHKNNVYLFGFNSLSC